MFGLGGGLDPKKMQAVMKQMGISQSEIEASRVIIEKTDSSRIIINQPSVTKMTIQGKDMFQIQGDIEEAEAGISEEDIKIVAEKTGKNSKEAKKALESADGDIAEAILQLSE